MSVEVLRSSEPQRFSQEVPIEKGPFRPSEKQVREATQELAHQRKDRSIYYSQDLQLRVEQEFAETEAYEAALKQQILNSPELQRLVLEPTFYDVLQLLTLILENDIKSQTLAKQVRIQFQLAQLEEVKKTLENCKGQSNVSLVTGITEFVCGFGAAFFPILEQTKAGNSLFEFMKQFGPFKDADKADVFKGLFRIAQTMGKTSEAGFRTYEKQAEGKRAWTSYTAEAFKMDTEESTRTHEQEARTLSEGLEMMKRWLQMDYETKTRSTQ